MTKKILIVYGSRFGNSQEIAKKITDILEEKEYNVTILNLKTSKRRDWPLVSEFDGVLVGSGIKIMKWTKEPLAFLKKNKDKLAKKTLGLFATSAFALVDSEKAINDYCIKIANDLGIQPKIYDVFGPVMDFSENSNLGKLNKGILKLAAKGISEETGIEIDQNGFNDLRDWEQIKDFAKKFFNMI